MWPRQKLFLLFIVLLNCSVCVGFTSNKGGDDPSFGLVRKDPETSMTMEEVVQYHGYTVENFDVQTEDGYILTIQRIPCGKVGSCSGQRKPVIIQHGLLCDASSWVINTPDKNLAYILADVGYDVWLTNVRGTQWGKQHTSLNATSREFWDFDWDQMAQYDLPEEIDYVLNKTGFSELFYVGYSMGTTIAFAMLSSKPEYNQKVKAVVALAPVSTTGHIRSPIRYLAPSSPLLCSIGDGEFLPFNLFTKWIASQTCGLLPVDGVCTTALFLLCGSDFSQFNQTRLPVYLHFLPAGASVRTIVHYAQTKPLEYNVTNVTTPVALFWSDNDYLADPLDVAELATKLPNVIINYRVKQSKFAHLDFIWALDVKSLLYDKVIAVMNDLWPEEKESGQ